MREPRPQFAKRTSLTNGQPSLAGSGSLTGTGPAIPRCLQRFVREWRHSPELPPWLRWLKSREIFPAHSIKRGQPFPNFLVPAKSIAPFGNTVNALVVSCVDESLPFLLVQVWLGKRKTGGDSTQICCLPDATYRLVGIGKIFVGRSSRPVLPKKIFVTTVINDPLSSVYQQKDTHILGETAHVIAERCQHLLRPESRGPNISPKVHGKFPNYVYATVGSHIDFAPSAS